MYYSSEVEWYPVDVNLGVTKIEQVIATVDRKGYDGLPDICVVNSKIVEGTPRVTFIITANRTGDFYLSPSIYIRGKCN